MSTALNLFPITLVKTVTLSPNVRHFVFQSNLSPAFNFIPGQFITIHFEHEGKTLRRSYSIANPPSEDNRIEFAAGYVENGPGTQLLFNLSAGDNIHINGPFGRLVLKDTPYKRIILVATSTGVTPYRAMLPTLTARLQANPLQQAVILFGVQHQEDLLYQEEFIAFAKAFPQQVVLRFQLSRATTDLYPYQHKGYVQHAFPEIALNPLEDIVYLCGNPGMIDESFELLKLSNFAMPQIIREKYISAR